AACAPLLQLDQDLAVASLTDIDGGLDAAAPDVARLSRHDVGLDVLGVRPTRIRLGHGRDAISLDLDQHVVHLVPVRGRPRARRAAAATRPCSSSGASAAWSTRARRAKLTRCAAGFVAAKTSRAKRWRGTGVGGAAITTWSGEATSSAGDPTTSTPGIGAGAA